MYTGNHNAQLTIAKDLTADSLGTLANRKGVEIRFSPLQIVTKTTVQKKRREEKSARLVWGIVQNTVKY